ncbi:MAG: DUF3243 family protein [Nitrospiraceae bacterium]|nr:DUF3243 family protein [Nitrospiraceae bacterium]
MSARVEESIVAKYIEKLNFIKGWKDWRSSLREGIQLARTLGLSDNEIQEVAAIVGDFLNKRVKPASNEDELLKQMWDVASPEERKVIASVLFKIVK